MAIFAEFPPELILHTVSFLTRDIILSTENQTLLQLDAQKLYLVPDFPSINALSQTNSVFHHTLDQTLYDLCESVKPLGKLAILFAVEHQLETALDKLVAAGISLDSEFCFADGWGQSGLLSVAATNGHQAMVVKLLEMYGDEMEMKVHARYRSSLTALDRAAFCGHMDVVRLLAPIPIPIPSSVHDTVQPQETHERYLSLALAQSTSAGKLEISKFLVSQGADINFIDQEKSYGGAPLMYASGTGNLALVQFLLASGADPNIRSSGGMVPLLAAENVDVLQALLGAGADIHGRNNYAENVLAFYPANIERLRFLLEHGADPNSESDTRRTLLHNAVNLEEAGDAKAAIELLLHFGATEVERADLTGYNPVDIAMKRGRSFGEVVKILEPLVQNPQLRSKIAAWWEEDGES
ncbi:ankyrin repeat-containing domain protein [Mycena galopus ATCC 62051]|nr:ankyrin repeat-containing domain protein [Mycena galopus ATCC 62051]